ncbi:DUF1636 family protein [Teichococcus aestuarii]|uniref:DUF1636 family protein n=1 Tax=Teichococcus aestuarii TaxID=568898 RepID=UPI00361B561F
MPPSRQAGAAGLHHLPRRAHARGRRDAPGRHLLAALEQALAAHPAPPVELRPVTCLSVCQQGCAAAMTQPGKWSYLLGRLSPALAADLLAYGETYAAHATGAVLPSRRPDSLRSVVLGRLPSLTETPKENAA